MAQVIPAILESSFEEIEKKIHRVEHLVKWVQIDIADETLVPNKTFSDPEAFKKMISEVNPGHSDQAKRVEESSTFRKLEDPSTREVRLPFARDDNQMSHSLNFEAHLMVKDPLRYLDRFAQAGFKRFYAHIEADFVDEYIAKCYQLGVEVGLAIDGPTPIEKIKPYIDNIDVVLVMAIKAGFSGQPFLEETTDRIKQLREWEFDLPIAVDGAMDDINAAKVVAAGATIICSNSYIFKADDVTMLIHTLKNVGEEVRKFS